MTAMVMIFRSEDSTSKEDLRCWVIEKEGEKILPIFDRGHEVQEFMKGWGIDGDKYGVSPTLSYPAVEVVALEAKEAGVSSYTSSVPLNPQEPILFPLPIDNLIYQARIMSGDQK